MNLGPTTNRRIFQNGIVALLLIITSISVLTLTPCFAEQYYISQSQSLQDLASAPLSPGDTILLQRGASWNEGITINASGSSQSRLNFGAYGAGDNPQVKFIKVNGNYITISDLTVDRNKEASDAVQVRGTNCTLQNLVVRNGTRDGIDANKADNLTIDNCHIHHFLNGSFSNQADAHGIVVTETQGVTIRNTEVHQVSGDSFQADPNRNAGDMTNNVLIDNCDFWTGPLTADFNSGWIKTSHLPDNQKQYPGENGIDTKVVKSGWGSVPRMQLTIRNTSFHGWLQDGYINNKAALNLKEKIEAVIEGATVYNSEIGFRLRGGLGNANVTINNTHIYDCTYAVRTEDNLENLTIDGSLFGSGNNEMLRTVSSSAGFDSWTIINNQFYETKPALASHASNTIVSGDQYASSPQSPSGLHIASASDPDPEPEPEPDPEPEPEPDPDPVPPGDHSHYETEKTKPGVVLYRAYRTDAEIRQDWTSMTKIPYGGRGSAYYDSNLDGAVIPIVGGIDEANSLRTSFAPITNELWAQWDMYIDQSFVNDLPLQSDDGGQWVNTKLFRFYNNSRIGCNNKNHDTLFIGWTAWNNSIKLDWEDTDDNGCGGAVVDLGEFGNKGDQWLRWTYYINFKTDQIITWITTMSGVTIKVADEYRPGLLAGGMDGIGPLLHSTSRSHHPDSDHPTYIFAFRNMIVSTNQIPFN